MNQTQDNNLILNNNLYPPSWHFHIAYFTTRECLDLPKGYPQVIHRWLQSFQ